MSHEIIKLGVLPNDGLGDPLRIAFDKINNNFATLFTGSDVTPARIVTGRSPNDGAGDTLRTAFIKLNHNFSELHTLYPEIPTATFNANDPLRTTFERINSTFSTLYEVITPNLPAVVDNVVEPVLEPAAEPALNDASFVGNINITNYNFFVDNGTNSKITTKSLPAPAAMLDAPLTDTIVIYGNQEWINVGAQPNDGTGDPLRVAFQKINNNFSNLFLTTTNTSIASSVGTAPNQVIYQIPTSQFTQGTFQIKSTDIISNDSQDITLSAQLTRFGTDVKFTGYGTTFSGNYVTRYDMDVAGGNVRILVNPILNLTLEHFISSQVTFIGTNGVTLELAMDGVPADGVLTTEDDLIITTENI